MCLVKSFLLLLLSRALFTWPCHSPSSELLFTLSTRCRKNHGLAYMSSVNSRTQLVWSDRLFVKKLDANSNASADTLHTHAGLYDDQLQVLADYVQTLGPPDLFEADRETLQTLRTKHVTVMNILGHMLATPELDD